MVDPKTWCNIERQTSQREIAKNIFNHFARKVFELKRPRESFRVAYACIPNGGQSMCNVFCYCDIILKNS